MTQRSTAIYHAKAAFSHMRFRGVMSPALVRFDTPQGTRFRFTYDAPDGSRFIVILRHASDYREHGGAVDALMTKAANLEAAQEPETQEPDSEPETDTQEPTGSRVVASVTLADLRAAFYFQADRLADAIDGAAAWMDTDADGFDSVAWA